MNFIYISLNYSKPDIVRDPRLEWILKFWQTQWLNKYLKQDLKEFGK